MLFQVFYNCTVNADLLTALYSTLSLLTLSLTGVGFGLTTDTLGLGVLANGALINPALLNSATAKALAVFDNGVTNDNSKVRPHGSNVKVLENDKYCIQQSRNGNSGPL